MGRETLQIGVPWLVTRQVSIILSENKSHLKFKGFPLVRHTAYYRTDS